MKRGRNDHASDQARGERVRELRRRTRAPARVPCVPAYRSRAAAPPIYTQKNSLGVVALVLGIMSFMRFGLLAGIPAIIVGLLVLPLLILGVSSF